MSRSRTVVDVATELHALNVREDRGANRDKLGVIAQMNGRVGAAADAPYCASTMYHLFFKTGAGDSFPKTASSQAIKRDFRDRGKLFTDPQRLLEIGGAVGGWTNEDDAWHGHVFLVVKRYTVKQADGSLKLVAIGTFEGNTGPDGGRDGNGIYFKKRVLSDDGKFYPVDDKGNVSKRGGHKLWFCDVTAIAGGDYW